jgi:predicted nucleotidyltransferase
VDALSRYVDQLLAQRGDEIDFVVLFGSRARGDWSAHSDYDVLVGLGVDDGQRLIDRMPAFSPREPFNVEIFPYSRSEWRRMFEEDHALLLEALRDGVVLWDRGAFAAMREQFRRWERTGRLEPWRNGWKIAGPAS